MKPSEICCDWLEARLIASKFSKIVLGGTAASHTCSGVGGGHFLIKKSDHNAVGSRRLERRAALVFFRFSVPDPFLFSFFVGLCCVSDTEG